MLHVLLLLRVQISSVRFFAFKKNAFISKQNEWTDQLKYCPLPTTFFHLSGNFRIPFWKNDSSLETIQFWSQFSISVKEVNRWLAASFGATSNQKEQCPENMANVVKHPIWAFVFQIFFYNFSDMRPSVVMKKNNFIMFLLVFRSFFSQCIAQTNQL